MTIPTISECTDKIKSSVCQTINAKNNMCDEDSAAKFGDFGKSFRKVQCAKTCGTC